MVNLFFKQQQINDGACTIYINNISPSEAKNLREALRKVDSVRNYLPLLNKVQTYKDISLIKNNKFATCPVCVCFSCLLSLSSFVMRIGSVCGTAS